MKKIRKIFTSVIFAAVCFMTVIPTSAATNQFSGSLEYRLLDGSKNNKYYTITANKKLTMSGVAYNTTYADVNASPNITYIYCYEGAASGWGTAICKDTVKVGLGGSQSFSASGISTKTKCYMYIYKVEDDGLDLSIGGSLVQ